MSKAAKSPASNFSRSQTLLTVVSLTLLGLIMVWGVIRNFDDLLTRITPLPVSLHSSTQANYSQDPVFLQIPPMNIELVIEAIRDDSSEPEILAPRLTEVNNNFFSPIASVTPRSTTNDSPDDATEPEPATLEPASPTPIPTSTTEVPLESSTPLSPSKTTSPEGTMDLTATASPDGTSPTPATDTTITQTATNTPVPPTATDTQVPPTATDTPVPPTATSSPCSSLSLSFGSASQKKTSWRIQNGSPGVITVSQITFSGQVPIPLLTRFS